jgi:hypothetical protein
MAFLLALLDLVLHLLGIVVVILAPYGVNLLFYQYSLVELDLLHDFDECLLRLDAFLLVSTESPCELVHRIVSLSLRGVHWERPILKLPLSEFLTSEGFPCEVPAFASLESMVFEREAEEFASLNNRDEPLEFLLQECPSRRVCCIVGPHAAIFEGCVCCSCFWGLLMESSRRYRVVISFTFDRKLGIKFTIPRAL